MTPEELQAKEARMRRYETSKEVSHTPHSANRLEGFLSGKERLNVQSSNISWFEYNPDRGELTMATTKGRVYLYRQISHFEAREFVHAASAGGVVWDRLRVRGTQHGTRKPYTRLA